eukprot:1582073-Pyramimonas_sp.AAC.1
MAKRLRTAIHHVAAAMSQKQPPRWARNHFQSVNGLSEGMGVSMKVDAQSAGGTKTPREEEGNPDLVETETVEASDPDEGLHEEAKDADEDADEDGNDKEAEDAE